MHNDCLACCIRRDLSVVGRIDIEMRVNWWFAYSALVVTKYRGAASCRYSCDFTGPHAWLMNGRYLRFAYVKGGLAVRLRKLLSSSEAVHRLGVTRGVRSYMGSAIVWVDAYFDTGNHKYRYRRGFHAWSIILPVP